MLEFLGGMDEDRKRKIKKITITVIIIIVAILIILGLVALVYYLVNRMDSGQSFVGMTGSYKRCDDVDKDALIVLYQRNKKLLDWTRTAKSLDIKRVYDVYYDFLKNCNPSRCPKTVYKNAKIMLDFIKYGTSFSDVDSNDWRDVRLGMNQMHQLLQDLFYSIRKVADTMSGSNDSYLSELSQQYVEANQDKLNELDRIKALVDVSNLEAEQILESLKDDALYRQSISEVDDSYERSLVPNDKGASSTYDYLLREGREKPFNGNVREWERAKNRKVINNPLSDDTSRNVDMRFARPGYSAKVRNVETISNYVDRYTLTSPFDGSDKCCK